MIVALGSTRRPKVSALERVLEELREELGPAEIRGMHVSSGVRETPLNRGELIAGARNRVDALQKQAPNAAYWVGLEGGLHAEGAEAWLENWACVSDGERCYCGC